MNNAPAVSYPVGRCAFGDRTFIALALCILALGGLVAVSFEPAAFFPSAVWTVCGLGLLAGGWRRYRRTQGVLLWDGQDWLWQSTGGEPQTGRLRVVWQHPKALLLQWQTPSDKLNGNVWCWLDGSHRPERWLDLRRAALATPTLD